MIQNENAEEKQYLEEYAELLPAYGRDYTSRTGVEKDWREGKDFVIPLTGQYCSIRDQRVGGTVLLRYKRATAVTPFKRKA